MSKLNVPPDRSGPKIGCRVTEEERAKVEALAAGIPVSDERGASLSSILRAIVLPCLARADALRALPYPGMTLRKRVELVLDAGLAALESPKQSHGPS